MRKRMKDIKTARMVGESIVDVLEKMKIGNLKTAVKIDEIAHNLTEIVALDLHLQGPK